MTDPWGAECRVAPILPVADVSAAAAYYHDKLGFSIRPVLPGSEEYWVVAERGSVEVHLFLKREDVGFSFAIRVADVDRLCDELLSRGAKFESGPMNQEYGERNFAVLDSNGTTIVFWQPCPENENNARDETEF